jgi:hypothetical protein
MKSSLHNQSPKEVIKVLNKCQDELARSAQELIENKHFRVPNETMLKQLKKTYGGDAWDTPLLVDDDVLLPWPKDQFPSQAKIRDIIGNEVDIGSYSIAPPSLQEYENVNEWEIASKLVENLDNPMYMEDGSIHNVKSKELDATASFQSWQSDGMLGCSGLDLSVLPAGGSNDLDYRDCWTLSTLLQGSLFWMIMPPTPENLELLREKYQKHMDGEETNSWEYVEQLTGTIAFVQSPGQMVYIPPCCLFAMISIETCVSAAYRIATVKKFHMTLHNLPLFLQRTYYDNSEAQAMKFKDKADTIQQALEAILTSSLLPFDSKPAIIQICRMWKDVKDDVRTVCESVIDEETSTAVQNRIKETFTKFLIEKGKKTAKCRLCGIAKKELDETYAEHFEHAHWNADGDA